ncbi:sodium:solute symporter family protein [Jatrophihabitans telluris]|uniref:Sodium:solute symporter family protein n=1 Tax=Jatrophihabitans telluris TaxID=2038343 RepID=A0ABY4QWH7_9ACTN|nr:sodium:solute symporter family protein [Jatrophihabitans telluris]UQX87324.1 sodium:solute symporter family protein [Jatrophihabitans telluris]
MLRLDVNVFDYVILAIYFALVIGIGVMARRAIATSEDFLLSGRSLPAWVTGLAFISANLGAIEILGMAANGAQYGLSTLHFYWIGAVPAMVFLGIVMMPFYYGSRVRSVPEFLLRRFNPATHLFNAVSFAAAAVLTAGVNLYALALVINALIGWPIWVSIIVSAAFVLGYITLGGLSGAIYNEVLQFFVIVAGLVPLVIIGLKNVGGYSGLKEKVAHTALGPNSFSTWSGTNVGHWTNPLGDWIGIVMGLGFVLSFGYWTTNFAEVQRALSAKDLSAAQRTPLIGSFPKIFIPALTIIPGLLALVLVPKLGGKGATDPTYNDAIPLLMNKFLPNGTLGIALAGLLAAFMAGMAANVSSFNTVFTYDIWQTYFVKGRRDAYYLKVGRIITVVGILIGIGTAFIASGYTNIMNYIQLLFSYFNAPLFATFIIAMFWKRATPWAGLCGLVAGTLGAGVMHFAGYHVAYFYKDQVFDPTHGMINAQLLNFYGAITAFVADAVVTVAVTLVTKPKPVEELAGLVWGVHDPNAPDPDSVPKPAWWASPKLLGGVSLGIVAVLSVIFA